MGGCNINYIEGSNYQNIRCYILPMDQFGKSLYSSSNGDRKSSSVVFSQSELIHARAARQTLSKSGQDSDHDRPIRSSAL